MVSTVKSRPNHYETLGLEPTASDDEIAPAFARQMLSPRPMLDAAQIGIAYAVLRDPIKRRDYDRSLGLNAKPEPRQWTYAAQPRWAPFIASAVAKRVEGTPEPHVTANLGAETPPVSRVQPEEASVAEAAAAPSLEPPIPDFLSARRAWAGRSRDADNSGIEWKFLAFAVGSIVLGVGLLGAWAGMSAGSDAATAQAEAAMDVSLPQARSRPSVAAAPPAPVATPAGTQTDWSVRDSVSASSSKRNALRRQATAWAERQVRKGQAGEGQAGEVQTGEGQADALTGDPLAPESSAAQPVAAKLPLPNRVIARTIERIGYACGQVASTVEGAAGVYKVTCTSGNSYRATPVRGRYRFRRLGGEPAP